MHNPKLEEKKGLCYNYDDKYAPGQKCKFKFFLLVGKDGEVEEPNFVYSKEINMGEDTGDSSGNSIYEVNMHAMAGL